MKILLIAYEFAPSPSPQSLRWIYLSIGLARLGHEVHVLAPDIPDHYGDGLPSLPQSVHVHRCFAGPVNGYWAWRRRQRRSASAERMGGDVETPPATAKVAEKLNWKGVLWHAGIDLKRRSFEIFTRILAWAVFPDIRGEWEIWAGKRLRRLLKELRPQVVISSHEPATTLRLGLIAQRKGYPWVADMGDPVLAPYTPPRWRRRSLRLEAEVCRRADRITIAAEPARALLLGRHGREEGVDVITQGFDECRIITPAERAFDSDGVRLDLLYTGSFYSFRTCEVLIQAVLSHPGVRLTLATMNPPDVVKRAAGEFPRSVRLLGFLPHVAALGLQRQADVLVNIGNALPDQVPGKIFEYMGAGKPILHIAAGANDGSSKILASTGRGIICKNDPESLAEVLAKLVGSDDIAADFDLDLSPQRVSCFSWGSSAARLSAVLESAAARKAQPR